MRKMFVSGAVLVAVGVVGVVGVVCFYLNAGSQAQGEKGKKALVAHNVYFSLKDNSAQARKLLLEACEKYLAKHEGEEFFAVGTLADELKRPVNDRDFDVGLHIVFRDMKAHDKYQDDPRHLKFIEENKDNWKKVRVFDTNCVPRR